MSAAGLVPGGDPEGVTAQAGLLRSQELVREVLSRPGYALSDAELLGNLRAVQVLAAMAEAVKLALVAELDARPGAVPGAVPGVGRGAVAVTFLTEGLRQSRPQAVRDVAAAAAIAPAAGPAELPQMGAALAAGEVSREHVDVAVSTLRRIPRVLKTKRIEGEDGVWRTGAQVMRHAGRCVTRAPPGRPSWSARRAVRPAVLR